jgi:uncharacterized membrane protein YebE (DUF533 family)
MIQITDQQSDLKNKFNTMKKNNYKNVLLEISVCAISCDGDIDDREINALKEIEKSSPYFSSEDLSLILEKSLKKCVADIDKFQSAVFKKLKKMNLNIVEQLTIMEIAFRIIAADEKEEDSEKSFMNELRKCLSITDFLLFQRFGEIDYLGLKDPSPGFVEFNKNEILNEEVEVKKDKK